MTTPYSDPEAFWNNLLDKLEQVLEAEQDAPGVSERHEDPDCIWKPPRPNRDGRGPGVPEDDRTKLRPSTAKPSSLSTFRLLHL